jgi:hypothetical protein
MDTDDDNKLIAQILSGDQQAYAYLVDKYKGPVYSLVCAKKIRYQQKFFPLAVFDCSKCFAKLQKKTETDADRS